MNTGKHSPVVVGGYFQRNDDDEHRFRYMKAPYRRLDSETSRHSEKYWNIFMNGDEERPSRKEQCTGNVRKQLTQ